MKTQKSHPASRTRKRFPTGFQDSYQFYRVKTNSGRVGQADHMTHWVLMPVLEHKQACFLTVEASSIAETLKAETVTLWRENRGLGTQPRPGNWTLRTAAGPAFAVRYTVCMYYLIWFDLMKTRKMTVTKFLNHEHKTFWRKKESPRKQWNSSPGQASCPEQN